MKKIILLLVLLFLISGGLYLYSRQLPKVAIDTVLIEKQPDKQENNKDLRYTVEILPIGSASNIPVPNLDRKVNFLTASENTKAKIIEMSEKLKTDTKNISLWIDLGSWRKAIEDYEGAKEAWIYVTVLAPKNSIALNNLGDIYAYYLKDIPKAEEYFLQAIHNEPSNIYLYFKTVDFYRYFAKDAAKARAILEKGIAANPSTSSDLKSLIQNVQPATSDLPR